MFQKMHKIINIFQNIQNRDFITGETANQKLTQIHRIAQERESMQQLIPYLRDSNKSIRDTVGQILWAKGWEPQSLTDKHIIAVSSQNWLELTNLPVQELILDWQKHTSLAPGGFWASYILSSLYEMGTPAFVSLLDSAKNKYLTTNARSIALHCLGLLKPTDFSQEMKNIYQRDKNKNIKCSVIEAFRLQGQSAVPIMADLLSNNLSDKEMCSSLSWALGFQGHTAVEILTSFLNKTNPVLRYYSGLALLATADPSALNILANLKGNKEDGQLKTVINQFFNFFGGYEAIKDQTNPIQNFNTEKLLDKFSQKKEFEAFIVSMLFLGNANRKEAAKPLFRTAINSDNDTIKIEALMSLSRLIPDQEAINLLYNGLKHGDNFIRYWSCLGLMNTGHSVIGFF